MSEEMMAFRQGQDTINLNLKSIKGQIAQLEAEQARYKLPPNKQDKLTKLKRIEHRLNEENFNLLAGK